MRRSAAAAGPFLVRLNLPALRFLGPQLVEADVEDRVRGQVAQEDDQEGSNGVRGQPPRRHWGIMKEEKEFASAWR